MGHRGRGEGRVVLVAGVTCRRRRHVVRRLAQRIGTVVAVAAGTGHDARMVEGSGRPCGRRAVAGTALQARRDMGRWLDLRILRKVAPAVAGRATGQAGVIHPGRRPGDITQRMAGIALTGHRDMRRRLGERVDRHVCPAMAGRTVPGRRRTGCPRMVHGGRPETGVVLVAGIALRRTRDMRGRLAQRRCPVVACRTPADGRRIMAESRRRPGGGRSVAGIALRRRADVRRGLDLRIDRKVGTAVTGQAISRRHRPDAAGMIHLGRREGGVIGMTDIAGRARRQVVGRLAQGLGTVVAIRARPRRDPGMVIDSRFPHRRSVAGVAGLGADRNMRCRTRLGIDRDIGTVVAGKTVACRTRVIHVGRRECGIALVAGVALRGGRNVVAGLGQPRPARLVAGIAGASRRGSMRVGRRRPGGQGAMAGIALSRGRHVVGRFVLGVVDQVGSAIAVTGDAVARCHRRCRSGMIHRARHERHETVAVTGIALNTGRNMCQGLGLRVDSRITAAMTGRALGCRSCMIHLGRLECRVVGVAGIALVAGRDMRPRFAQRGRSIMASRTGAGRRRRVSITRPRPTDGG